ncbi:MAG: hypothetical protein P8M81_05040 [Litorivicinaceae bacterium]|nr:hypothetical protein [Litorivicinaceae bacterium]
MMEWILGILIIILGVVAVFVIYLSERVTVFETLLGINPKVTGEKLAEHVNFGPNPFGELSGKDLWDAMCGEELENSEIEFDPADLDKKRPRYEFVLSKHLESLVEEGRFDARNGERSEAKAVLRIQMLRGSVESYIPFAEASRLYEIGQELETPTANLEKLKKETDEIVGEIFSKVSIEVPKTLVDSMLSMSQLIIEADADDFDDFADDDVEQNLEQLPAPDSDSESESMENKSS